MYLKDVIKSVNETHPGLGELVAMCQLATTARKILLIISPSGCGKSRAMDFVAKAFGSNTLKLDRTSVSGLANFAEELDCSDRLIVVDDLSTTQTMYARASTMTALAALVYSHGISSAMGDLCFEISEFTGSALVGIQPIILKELLMFPEWEGSIRDKVIRYYHLRRPIEPYLDEPTTTLKLANIEKVKPFEPDKKNIYWQKLLQLALMEFSRARAKEHLIGLLKANCALDNRTEVLQDDYEMVESLLRQQALEVISIKQPELEGNKELDRNLLYLLVEYFTYNGKFSLAQVAQDYHITLQQCYKIIKGQSVYWDEISKKPTLFKPSKYLTTILKRYSLEIDGKNERSIENEMSFAQPKDD